MVKRGNDSLINMASVLALLPGYSRGIYAATKSYVVTLSQGLSAEVAAKGVYVQAVLPAATCTEIYERSGGDISQVPDVMEVDDLVRKGFGLNRLRAGQTRATDFLRL